MVETGNVYAGTQGFPHAVLATDKHIELAAQVFQTDGQFLAILVGECLGVVAVCIEGQLFCIGHQSGMSLLAVEEEQTRCGVLLVRGHVNLHGIALVRSGDESQTAVLGRCALAGNAEGTLLDACHLCKILLPCAPLPTDGGRCEIVRGIGVAAGTLRDIQILYQTIPSALGPLDGFHQRIAAQGVGAVLIGMIDDPPLSVRTFDDGAMTL